MTQQKVTIPAAVADAIAYLRTKCGWQTHSLLDVLNTDIHGRNINTITAWLQADPPTNIPLYARAVLDGYEVEDPRRALGELVEELCGQALISHGDIDMIVDAAVLVAKAEGKL